MTRLLNAAWYLNFGGFFGFGGPRFSAFLRRISSRFLAYLALSCSRTFSRLFPRYFSRYSAIFFSVSSVIRFCFFSNNFSVCSSVRSFFFFPVLAVLREPPFVRFLAVLVLRVVGNFFVFCGQYFILEILKFWNLQTEGFRKPKDGQLPEIWKPKGPRKPERFRKLKEPEGTRRNRRPRRLRRNLKVWKPERLRNRPVQSDRKFESSKFEIFKFWKFEILKFWSFEILKKRLERKPRYVYSSFCSSFYSSFCSSFCSSF